MVNGSGRLVSLLDDLYLIRGTLGSNVYLITNSFPALVDAGFPLDKIAIRRALKEGGRRSDNLSMIVATHYHGDHVGAISALQNSTMIKSAIHEDDAPFARGEIPLERFKVDLLRTLYYRSLWPLFKYRHFRVDLVLREGDFLDLLGGLEVIHTPGHSLGSICLYQKDKKILFSGDLIRNEKGILEGPPPNFTPQPWRAIESLNKIAQLDFDILLPGHGIPILKGAGKRFRALLHSRQIWPLDLQPTKNSSS